MMSFSLKLYSRVREYMITSTDEQLHGNKSSSGNTSTFWMFTPPQAPTNSYDEVYPGVYCGDMKVALDNEHLNKIGITHIINCSQGKGSSETNTDSMFYQPAGIKFHGIKAQDSPTFNMTIFYKEAVEFMDKALKSGGKVFVHCSKGVSRSPTIVIAYLMMKCNMDLMSAMRTIRPKRKIHPNDGFIRQLCILNRELYGDSD
ncbi:dual specificity protein phosphatase 3-like [Dreissena polymorpha]|uniref:Dual specificity protein phosphatase n=1 Tax=Dreissena polymorpha TaxID=45954 RepID=A0A9D4R604_DREPO|nr:dual specificity protein phosphatase 3-like [Dreissena polymorpha]KAH3855182.1 hypothetical protein DPMN_097746 [Dreissena polymorpha]